MEWLHSILNTVVDWAILLFESMGVVVIVVSGIQGIVEYVTGNPLTRLNMAKGMAMGLEFKLGSEILRKADSQALNMGSNSLSSRTSAPMAGQPKARAS